MDFDNDDNNDNIDNIDNDIYDDVLDFGFDRDNDDGARPNWDQFLQDVTTAIQELPNVFQEFQDRRGRSRTDRLIIQKLQQIERRLDSMETRAALRAVNVSRNRKDSTIRMFPNNRGAFPVVGKDGVIAIPATRGELEMLLVAQTDALIAFYGLAVPNRSSHDERKVILSEHLGIY